MCLQPSIPVIAYLLPLLQFCNLPPNLPQPSSSICWNCHCPASPTSSSLQLHPDDHTRYFCLFTRLFFVVVVVNLRTEILFLYCRWLVSIWPLLSSVLLFDMNKAYNFYVAVSSRHCGPPSVPSSEHLKSFLRHGQSPTVMEVSILVLGLTLHISAICRALTGPVVCLTFISLAVVCPVFKPQV